MQVVRVPKAVLGAEIRAGHVSLFRVAGTAAVGRFGGAVDALADAGLKRAVQESDNGVVLQWPDFCCKCLTKGRDVRPVAAESVANRGVAYVFRFAIPHCKVCADTASKKRAGSMGMLALGLVVAVLTVIGMMFTGMLMEVDWLVNGAIVGGPLAGVLVPYAWSRVRDSGGRRGSRYQAVCASSIDLSATGVPTACELSFENAAYASRFASLNKSAGVTLG